MTDHAVDPTPEQVQALVGSGIEGPVMMINLIRFKPDGGLASYQRYAQEVVPHLERVGGAPLAMSAAGQTLIGEGERPWWDAIITVEYPSVEAFIQMVSDPGYADISRFRTEALERAELIVTRPGTLS